MKLKATPAQVRYLKILGMSEQQARAMNIGTASKHIEKLSGKLWGKPKPKPTYKEIAEEKEKRIGDPVKIAARVDDWKLETSKKYKIFNSFSKG